MVLVRAVAVAICHYDRLRPESSAVIRAGVCQRSVCSDRWLLHFINHRTRFKLRAQKKRKAARVSLAQRPYNPPEGSAFTDGLESPAFRLFAAFRAAPRSTSRAHADGFCPPALLMICRSAGVMRIKNMAVLRLSGVFVGAPRFFPMRSL